MRQRLQNGALTCALAALLCLLAATAYTEVREDGAAVRLARSRHALAAPTTGCGAGMAAWRGSH